MSELMPVERIEKKIYLIRNQKVMLDRDIAELYGVATKALNQAVRRNIERFPKDFMFKLAWRESAILRSQFVTLKINKQGKHQKYRQYAFTEQGIAMLSSVLKSKRSIQVNIAIMRTFVRLKQILATHKDLEQKLLALEENYESRFRKHDTQIQAIFDAIKKILAPPNPPKRKIGFLADR